jgi:hydrogenase maturation factor
MLFTGARDTLERLRSEMDAPLAVIGEMVPDGRRAVRLLDGAGREVTFKTPGWDQMQSP